MNPVKTAVIEAVKPVKRERAGTCTHIITWGYDMNSELAWDGDFAYCYGDQVDMVVDILQGYKEVGGITVCAITVEKAL